MIEQVSIILPVKFLKNGDEVTKITGQKKYIFKSTLHIYKSDADTKSTVIEGQPHGGFLFAADGSIISVCGDFLVKITMPVMDVAQFGQDLREFVIGEDCV